MEQITSISPMIDRNPRDYQDLSIPSTVATLLGVTGWYGAELAYRHKIGVVGSSSRSE